MTRFHGRNAAIYLGQTTNAAASPLMFQSAWTLNKTVQKVDVTAFGDANHIYVAGLPDSSGDFSGFMDDATSQTYLATVDGLPRNFYLYPNITSDPYFYFFGQVLADMSSDGGVSSAVTVKSAWNAASKITRYTQWGGLDT